MNPELGSCSFVIAMVALASDQLACRELTHYKGDPDPFKGDVLNQKVRDAAKETVDAIFQATDTNYNSSSTNSSSTKPTLTVMLTLLLFAQHYNAVHFQLHHALQVWLLDEVRLPHDVCKRPCCVDHHHHHKHRVVLQNRIQGFGSTDSSEPDHASSSSRGNMGGYSGGFSSSSNNNNSSSSNGGGMVGFGNPRFDSSSSNKPSGASGSSKWLPASVANKLDSLSMLPKDRAGGLRFEVCTVKDMWLGVTTEHDRGMLLLLSRHAY